ncbi:MAG: glycosyltransferase family 39 protein [Proteobacteria bacterium]|nr:glycosyltransferase family 39 protein [Pseudomonadota bacterium]
MLRIKKTSLFDSFVFSYAIGIGLISLLIFYIASFGFLYSTFLYPILFLLVIASIPKIFAFLKSLNKSSLMIKQINWPYLNIIIFTIIGIYILILMIQALCPPTEYDSLVYHLADPKAFLKYKQLIYQQVPGIDIPLGKIMPFNFEMLYIIPLFFGRDALAQLFQLGSTMIALLAVYNCTANLFSARVGLMAIAILSFQPAVAPFMSSAKPDTALLLYAVLAVYSIVNWFRQNDSKWLLLCGIFSGFYLAGKLSGLILAVYLFIPILFKSIYRHRIRIGRILSESAIFLLPVVIIAGPWLIRTWFITGDPIYPYLTKFFGRSFITEISHQKSLMGFIKYPWDLTFNTNVFLAEGGITPIYLAIFPVIFILKRISKPIIYLSLFSMIYIYTFYFLHVQSRYFLVGIVGLAIVCAYLIDKILRSDHKIYKIITLILLFSFFSQNLYALVKVNVPKFKVALGSLSRQQYLRNSLRDYYFMAEYVNNNLPINSTIFSPWENRFYYFDCNFLSGNWMVSEMLKVDSVEEWRKILKEEYKANYLLLAWDYHRVLIRLYENGHLGYDPRKNLLFSNGMEKYLSLVHSNGDYVLYKIL